MPSADSANHNGERQGLSKWVNEYYLELEGLLRRIEASTNHYQVLGIDKTASGEEIKSAYAATVKCLQPTSSSARYDLPEQILFRMDRACERVAGAFAVLANFGKRTEYDNSLSAKGRAPIQIEIPTIQPRPGTDSKVQSDTRCDPPPPREVSKQPPAGEPAADERENRRRFERIKLAIPVRVVGYEQKQGKWAEMGQTINVNRIGVSFRIRRRVAHGLVVHLNLPMPIKLRNHGHADPTYGVYAIVRRVQPPKDGLREVGVEFIGEHPPKGYFEKPWKSYRTAKWSGPDRRRETRKRLSEPVEVFFLNEAMEIIECQLGLMENVSSHGGRVYINALPDSFDWVRVIGRTRGFESLAAIRNQFTGSDGFERLCIEFIGEKWPH